MTSTCTKVHVADFTECSFHANKTIALCKHFILSCQPFSVESPSLKSLMKTRIIMPLILKSVEAQPYLTKEEETEFAIF